ncbi:divergent polysaccharide deacetylase family protein [Aureibacillus halotolerans]|uniref:Divergent polysaccharide deacetylase n=1 Tax=Aureibacillus halotolerans TaxID=1508390 RepID=A0A4R6U749_9BACI|nr:divergent polysaccharide deacetylase family protein [Aureibacillus halotolerans]TDQ40375.1 hypothetical protein EV213_10691 [Aureibacillus halotolerans]
MSVTFRMILSFCMLLSPGLNEASAQMVSNEISSAMSGRIPDEQSTKKISIVIDDFGNRMVGTEAILALPIPLTVAVMPFLRSSKEDAEGAHRRGHEVIIHMPMEPNYGKKEWLGPGALTTDLDDAEIRKRVEAAIANIPHAVGMNNHMGSKVTADRRIMAIVMEVCREHGLFYLDSRTTYKSVIPEVAAAYHVPVLSNKLFLDDRYTQGHIQGQLGLLMQHLQEDQDVIAIGHVGPSGKNVASTLRQWSSEVKNKADFVTASQLISPEERELQILP